MSHGYFSHREKLDGDKHLLFAMLFFPPKKIGGNKHLIIKDFDN
jgi:hypothetical protein